MCAGREEGGGPAWGDLLVPGGRCSVEGVMGECGSAGAHCPSPRERGQAGRGLSGLEVGLQHGSCPLATRHQSQCCQIQGWGRKQHLAPDIPPFEIHSFVSYKLSGLQSTCNILGKWSSRVK